MINHLINVNATFQFSVSLLLPVLLGLPSLAYKLFLNNVMSSVVGSVLEASKVHATSMHPAGSFDDNKTHYGRQSGDNNSHYLFLR